MRLNATHKKKIKARSRKQKSTLSVRYILNLSNRRSPFPKPYQVVDNTMTTKGRLTVVPQRLNIIPDHLEAKLDFGVCTGRQVA